MKYQLNDVVEGTVSGIANFGAFIDLPDGTRGLVYISEISDDYVKNIGNYLSVGQKVKVAIIEQNEEKGRIALSIRKANPDNKFADVSGGQSGNRNFEKMMKNYLRNSTDVIKDLGKRDDRY